MAVPEAVEREALSRGVVVAAARAQIVAKGLDELSLRKLGASLGVTAPALYAYVTDKRDLVRGVAEGEFGALLERFMAVREADPVLRLRLLCRSYVDYALENPELYKTMFLFPPELEISEPTGVEIALATRTFRYAVGTIEEAIEAGRLRVELDPVVVSFVCWTATHGLATVLLLGFAFDEATRDMLIDTVLDTMIRGLGG